MAVIKCKMCGGTLNVKEGSTICECEYCGTSQTLSKSNNEQTINMLNRASHFRQQCEFDKAMEIYEKLIESHDNDAEIYWQMVLCRYGIEYVDDPITKKKIPTCHRTQFNSILKDVDYLEAVKYADCNQRELYKKEAEYIDGVQKNILEISNKEKPFDVFICYKESDKNGKRTQDSVLAQELYYQLEHEGFKVFFSRITLESKLGTEYEPYIFAALNSAKVMVVVGTKSEYFDAVWVKNEWSRFLMLMQEDHSRTLIPAYKDMDPYDLPDELSMLQSQDMSKLGFMQDLIRGIKKITSDDKPEVIKETVVVNNSGNAGTAPMIKRAFIFLEDSDWDSADEYAEKILDIDPECAEAYIIKMMVELKVKTKGELKECREPFDQIKNYKKAYRFASDSLKNELQGYNDYIVKEGIYVKACETLLKAVNEKECLEAQKQFESLNEYKDTLAKIEECKIKVKDIKYTNACIMLENAVYENECLIAKKAFEGVNGYKDSYEKIKECDEKAKNCWKAIKYQEGLSHINNNTIDDLKAAITILSDIQECGP